MVNFKWKKDDGKLTNKAKTYLKLTYKNQYSKGIGYNNKEEVAKELEKLPSQKPNIMVKKLKNRIYPKTTKTKLPKTRRRKQKAINFKNNTDPYYVSIRVITINPEVTESGLKQALIRIMRKYQGRNIYLQQKNKYITIDFKSYYQESVKTEMGSENIIIGNYEDMTLNDLNIHYEVIIEKNKAEIGIIR